MRWGDVIYLINQTWGKNEYGDPVIINGPPREVYANRKSVRQSEFYQAAVADLRPEIMFEVRSTEYQGEPKVRYDGRDYSVIRTYERGEIVELVCSGLVGPVKQGG